MATPEMPSTGTARAEFLTAMRRVPGAVAVIATGQPGHRMGLAATAWASLTADPPTILACINETASAHDGIVASGRFSLCLLPDDHEETVAIFSKRRGLDGDARFLAESWTSGPNGLPILKDAAVSFECTVVGVHKVGTHSTVFGAVDFIATRPQAEPLVYFDGAFARLSKQTS